MSTISMRSPRAGDAPHALTFFLTPAERRQVLRALRRRHTDRARALCLALRVQTPESETKGGAR